jgi:phage terminase large subunit-like protein
MKADPKFPRFEFHCFPAHKPGDGGWDYLFPEHFSPQWYDGQRATLGRGMSAALLDLNPIFEGGNRFDVRKVILHETKDGWPAGREVRFWDPASSSAQRDKSDPDWTWGCRGTTTKENTPYGSRLSVWISAMTACRDEAPRRNELIRQTAKADGPAVAQYVENWGGYKDAYTDLKEILRGVCIVNPSRLPGDKSAKAAILEPAFDNSAVHVYLPGCRDVLDEWKRQFEEFPNGKHDDAVDATAGMAHSVSKAAVTLLV